MRKTSIILSVAVLLSTLSGCAFFTPNFESTVMDINIFKDTAAWELAQAVDSQNTSKIAKLAAADTVNVRDETYDVTLLIWAVGMEKYKSAEALLKNGADPDIISEHFGYTALYLACGYSWIDNVAKKDAKYVKLLLEYGADPNICLKKEELNVAEYGRSPLMESVLCGLDKTKALVEAGADINYKTPSGDTAAIEALSIGPNRTIDAMRYAHYLIVEKHAIVTDSYELIWNGEVTGVKEPVANLRDWIPKLDSEEYKLKMDIVEEFDRQGVDYWATEIPQDRLSQIKKLYPDTWQEYVQVY